MYVCAAENESGCIQLLGEAWEDTVGKQDTVAYQLALRLDHAFLASPLKVYYIDSTITDLRLLEATN